MQIACRKGFFIITPGIYGFKKKASLKTAEKHNSLKKYLYLGATVQNHPRNYMILLEFPALFG